MTINLTNKYIELTKKQISEYLKTNLVKNIMMSI